MKANYKTKLFLLLSLALLFASTSGWSQVERKLVIEPAVPYSNDLITISVTNSECYSSSQVVSDLERNHFQIGLRYFVDVEQACLEDNVDDPEYEITVGPLEPGNYSIALFLDFGRGGPLIDEESFTVLEGKSTKSISEGGINGLYHRPDSPHQYFYVLETNYNTMLVWNTFDSDGNQLWVYGVGELSNGGKTVVAKAYINLGTGLFPNGEPEVDAKRWGVIRLDMTSCNDGTVTYKSSLPEFDDGEFDIVRLAYSKQIGCVNRPE